MTIVYLGTRAAAASVDTGLTAMTAAAAFGAQPPLQVRYDSQTIPADYSTAGSPHVSYDSRMLTYEQVSVQKETSTMFTIDARDKRRLQAEKAIDIIAGLPEDWNCNGAPAIPSDVVERARDILARLPQIPAVSPTAMSGIQLDYEDNEAGYIEFELMKDGLVEMYFEDADQTKDLERVITDKDVPDVVKKFYEKAL